MLFTSKYFHIPPAWLKLDNYFRKVWTENKKGEDPLVLRAVLGTFTFLSQALVVVVVSIHGAIFIGLRGILLEPGHGSQVYWASVITWGVCLVLLWSLRLMMVDEYKDFCVELIGFAKLLGYTSSEDLEKFIQISVGPLKKIVWDKLTEVHARLLQEQDKLMNQAADADVQKIRLRITEYDATFEDLLRRTIFWKLQESGNRRAVQDSAWTKLRSWQKQEQEEKEKATT